MAEPAEQQTDVEIDTSNWPDSLITIANAIGPEAALVMVDNMGGLREVYVPKIYRRDNALARVIGEDAYKRLVAALGGQRIDVPRAHFKALKKSLIIALAEQFPQMSRRKIALKVRCTEDYVRTVLNTFQTNPQLNLFGENN